MAARGRPPGKPGKTIGAMSNEQREKISKSRIFSDLIAAAEGRIEMTPTQAMIALKLIDKVLPTLAHVKNDNEHSGNVQFVVNTGVPRHISDSSNIIDGELANPFIPKPVSYDENEELEIDRLIRESYEENDDE